ncbi:hypothetical protein HN832_04330 [archaeon]|jgi:hypothetical protein|nr:hypothetical protein [archaeon]MBT4373378.1 hypothetical protein [archaeon]MBT4531826.1 hypothetical protein [archaeon]MBT7001493.1 hypothetical protein [archaeon]MBT7282615.1 hypothetical protein [archaeon]
MTDLKLENNDLVERLRDGELNVATISSAIEGDYESGKAVERQFAGLSIDELEELGLEVIEFLSFITPFMDESEPLEKRVLELKGKSYSQQLERARLIAWQGFGSKDYSSIKGVQALLEQHKDCDLREGELNDCKCVKEIKAKLDLYSRLFRGELSLFYTKGIDIFETEEYKLRIHPGSWENFGGVELHLFSQGKSIMQVGGKIHNYAEIRSIHGGKKAGDAIAEFKESTGVHPANLNLLLFLKLSQHLRHKKLTIRGRTSRAFNMKNVDSPLYLIPRNYFRLKANPENGLYEFEETKRDALLEKFAKNNPIIENAFASMDSYLSAL